MTFAPGALVRAREREWVVLPESTDDLLVLRPLGGTDDEVAGVLPAIERVEQASFEWPDPAAAGDHASARLLRDAVRIGFRSSAGPFRSFGAIAVDPRPYQVVPLLMALRQNPVRLLIADDVGIGKTIEAALIAKELLVSGQARRLSVLCPPHLAEQWQSELATKFHIEAETVLTSTARRLERNLGPNESVFEAYPYTIVSTDFIKSNQRRDEFIRSAADLLIVDEAHTCAASAPGRSASHQRYELVRDLARDPDRHLVLVTATPHSGNESAFRSLIGLLHVDFANLPDEERIDEATRRRLARHFVQRRRNDIREFVDATVFPERLELPEADGRYSLTPEYRAFLDDVLAWARSAISDDSGGQHRQRVRWWAVLGLLRALASSPTAAAVTLRNRAAPARTTTLQEADDAGRRSVLDLDDSDDEGRSDAAPGADADEDEARRETKDRARLRKLAERADALAGAPDAKLTHVTKLLERLIDQGHNPIVFCRFIPTAGYVADHLRQVLPKRCTIDSVTGLLPPDERERRIEAMADAEHRVLVATDCLSEGINLQSYFDAVVHYDLPWNPTRLEQREGRVDRFGQTSPQVRVATVYGVDNVIDEIVLEVLLRKHRAIRSELGVSIPVPGSNDEFIESVFERLFRKDNEQLSLLDDDVREVQQSLFDRWDDAAAREKASRTRYAQYSIKTDEVRAELAAVRAAIGAPADIARFVREAVHALGGSLEGDGVTPSGPPVTLRLRGLPPAARDLLEDRDTVIGRFEPSLHAGEEHLARTHPVVEGLATHLLDTALDAQDDSPAARCGAIRTAAVRTTTTLLLARYRFDLIVPAARGQRQRLLAEDVEALAFEGLSGSITWLEPEAVQTLLAAQPSGNVVAEQRVDFLRRVIGHRDAISGALAERAATRAAELAETHERVRREANLAAAVRVEPHLPVDVLGLYVYLPQ
ncbi:MAG: ATP-dependent helicase HepA [Acidimicrobiia bacterium]|nr:MAG: ATP-dependent helicase HepA [Acidimicrobiia bacterium]